MIIEIITIVACAIISALAIGAVAERALSGLI